MARLSASTLQAVPWNFDSGTGDVVADPLLAMRGRDLTDTTDLTIWEEVDNTGAQDGPNQLYIGASATLPDEWDSTQLWGRKSVALNVDLGTDASLGVIGPLYGFPAPAGVSGIFAVPNIGLNAFGAFLSPTFFGGSNGVLFIGNGTLPPASNPVNGAYIYTEGGAAKVRGSSGTVTTFGPADPHCKKCGSDHNLEFLTEDVDEYTRVCLRCLLGALASLGVDVESFSERERT